MGKKNGFLVYFIMAVAFLLRAGAAGADPVIQISDPSADMAQSQTCILKGRITDSTGTAAPIDIHAGVVLPDGSIYELDSNFTFQPLDLSADPSLSHPLARDLTLNAGTDSGEVTLFGYQFTGNEPAGTYTLFVAATDAGAFNVKYIDTEGVIYTPSPAAPTMSLACVGVEHYSGYSKIKVCVYLTNVPDTDWQNFRGVREVGGSDIDGENYFSRYDSGSGSSGFMTKACSSFTINQYGNYSGVMGISTAGGTAAHAWDITVTSVNQVCD